MAALRRAAAPNGWPTWASALGPWGDDLGARPGGLTLAEVKQHPNGLRLAELAGGRLDEVGDDTVGKGRTAAPISITDDIPRLLARIDRPNPELVLTSRRHLRSNNSWLHNVPALMQGQRPLHPAHPSRRRRARRAVASGAAAAVSTTEGVGHCAGRSVTTR